MKRYSLGYQEIGTSDGGGVRVPGLVQLDHGDYLEIGGATVGVVSRYGSSVTVRIEFDRVEHAITFSEEAS